MNDLPNNVWNKIIDYIYWKQYYTTLPYISRRFRWFAEERIFRKMHPANKPSNHHDMVVEHYLNYGNDLEDLIKKFRRGEIPCTCTSARGRRKEMKYIRRHVIEKKLGRPFFFDDRDTDESDDE